MKKTKTKHSKIYFYPLLFALFPLLSLFAHNISEVNPQVILRPLMVTLAGATVILLLTRVLWRDGHKAALFTTWGFVLFFSYRPIYEFLRNHPIQEIVIGRHRYLAAAFAVALLVGLILLIRRKRPIQGWTRVLTLVGIMLVLLPIGQAVEYAVRERAFQSVLAQEEQTAAEITPVDPEHLPDVYLIVMDNYTRADAMLADFNYDNSAFITALRDRGFYIADCARTNYTYTLAALTASLNLNYLPEINQGLIPGGGPKDKNFALMKHSWVRSQLESIGYKTVAFENNYPPTEMRDAAYFYSFSTAVSARSALNEFESMYLENTAAVIFNIVEKIALRTRYQTDDGPYKEFIANQRFILNELPKVALKNEPKFVFAHLMIPHVPYVFDKDGNINTDPAFYNGPWNTASDRDHKIRGYVGEVEFINRQMLEIIDRILATSKNPPIIILQGDHGVREENRCVILNAYYFPNQDYDDLYATISPVNTYRVLFNRYFGTNFDLLPDKTYLGDDYLEEYPEFYPTCKQTQ